MDLKLIKDTPNNKMDIAISLTKIVFYFNISTYTRIMDFVEKMKQHSNKILVQKTQFVRRGTIKEKLDTIE